MRVGKKVFVLGASDQALSKLGEVDEAELDLEAPPPSPTFREVFQRALGKGKGDAG